MTERPPDDLPDLPTRIPRISLEKLAVDAILQGLPEQLDVYRGHAKANRYNPAGWELTMGQQWQYGDLRIETTTATVIVEVESAGGVTNLVKYWPLLAARHDKRFVIAHVFRVTSAGDYIAHRRLWQFLVDRMDVDLRQAGIRRPDDWDAQIFTYRTVEDLSDVLAYISKVA